jgi:ABC-type antimicrobial peptide transport system permease subunit
MSHLCADLTAALRALRSGRGFTLVALMTLALGARTSEVFTMILRQGMRPVLFGLAVGLAGSLAVARVLRSLLFEVRPDDPLTLFAGLAALALIGALACATPALRAARTDPLTVIRYE